MALHGLVAVAFGEWNLASAFTIGASLAVIAATLATIRLATRKPMELWHGMATVGALWLVAPVFAAVSLLLSGHFASYLDAYFDAMSGLTTSGLTLIQDLDHAGYSLNLWRHSMQFVGGMGIAIVLVSLFGAASAHANALYVGEAREERILPNLVRTARFILLVSAIMFAVGTLALTIAGIAAGLTPPRALFHGVTMFMAAFSTGGFAPYSQSAGYYHSLGMELTLLVLMFTGAFSFGLHYQLWRGSVRELYRSLEARTFLTAQLAVVALGLIGLARAGTFTSAGPLFRKGVFTLMSAQTTTGFQVNQSTLYVSEWGSMAPAAIVIAMSIGAMAGSTGGGIKAFRVGIVAKGIWRDIRRVLMPKDALVVETYHSVRRQILREEHVRAAATVLLLYLLTYLAGGIVGLFYGYEFTQSMFESTSATGTVGLSIGVTAPDMPTTLKLLYIGQMWVGRLEFISVFVLLGSIGALVRRPSAL
ncbi:MAG: TrkH family potassium uptake protein [Nitriliruptorales bacterium]